MALGGLGNLATTRGALVASQIKGEKGKNSQTYINRGLARGKIFKEN